MNEYTILAINPGSTSTKIAVFKGQTQLYSQNIKHTAGSLAPTAPYAIHVQQRVELIQQHLQQAGIDMAGIDAYAGRGGGIACCPGGTYEVSDFMLEYIQNNPLLHPSKYGGPVASYFARLYGKKAYIVNSPHTDEYDLVARISGLAGIYKDCNLHALNQKEVAIRAAKTLGKRYNQANLVVAHLGGGTSIAAHKNGRMVDASDALNGDGPMSPTRTGHMEAMHIVELCYSGDYTKEDMRKLITSQGGMISHLGTSDGLEIETMVKQGQPYAKLVFDAMLYQTAKCIGAMAAALDGEVDAVVLTGGLLRDEYAASTLTRKTKFIAPVILYPGEFEMEALANGVLRVLTGEEEALPYTGQPTFTGLDPAEYPLPTKPQKENEHE